jgi:hypothetical protein
MSAHEAEGMAAPVVPLHRLAEKAQKECSVRVVSEDCVTVDTPRGYVVEAVRKVLPQRPRHVATIFFAAGLGARGCDSCQPRHTFDTNDVAERATREGQTLTKGSGG